MKNFFQSILFLFCFVSLGRGQCNFPTYDNLGLECDQATYLCGYELDGYNNTLHDFISPGNQPPNACPLQGMVDNVVWFAFLAESNNLELEVNFSNCTDFSTVLPGLQVSLFDDCTFSNYLYCFEQEGYASITVDPDPAEIVPGNIYYLMIDGYGGSVCDFSIDVISGVCTDEPPVFQECEQNCGVISQSIGNTACTYFSENFVFQPTAQILTDLSVCNPQFDNTQLDSMICVEWEIIPSTGYNIISDSTMFYDSLDVQSIISVVFTEPGEYLIKPILNLSPLFNTCETMCVCTDDVAYTLTVEETVIDTLPAIYLCPGDCENYCGSTYCSEVEVTCYDKPNCRIEVQQFLESEINFIYLDTTYICEGECYEFNNVPYCTENIFSIPHETACDSSYILDLRLLDIEMELIQDDSMLTCDVIEATLEGMWTCNYDYPINSYWLDRAGDTISFDDIVSVQDSGTYYYHVVPEDKDIICTQVIEHFVGLDGDLPILTIDGPDLNCTVSSGNLTVMSTVDIDNYNWLGPSGFISFSPSPLITESGTYHLSVIGENGCANTDSITITLDTISPQITIVHDDFDCTDNLKLAQFEASIPVASQEWLMPDGSIVTDSILSLTTAGAYVLTVIGENGCSGIQSITVQDMTYDPSIGLAGVYEWTCNDSVQQFDLVPLQASNTIYSVNSIDGDYNFDDNFLEINELGTYIIESQDTVLGCVALDTIIITGDSDPFTDIEIEANSAACIGVGDGYLEVVNISGGDGPYIYTYYDQSSTNIEDIVPTVGEHTLMVTDANGCEVSVPFTISEPQEVEVFLEPQVSIDFNEASTVSCTYNVDESEVFEIRWIDEDENGIGTGESLTITTAEDQVVGVILESVNGCLDTAFAQILVKFDVNIYYPNIFSPNGDLNNDLFMLYNNGNPEMMDDLKIYDRAGELVYIQSQLPFNETNNGWDGTFNGQPCQQGVYVFLVQYTQGDGQKITESGTITLVR